MRYKITLETGPDRFLTGSLIVDVSSWYTMWKYFTKSCLSKFPGPWSNLH